LLSHLDNVVRHTIEFSQTPFCETPERFDTIDMPLTTGKLVVTMVNPEMFIKADIDQSVIATTRELNYKKKKKLKI
jgi:hypothetical protein